MPCAFLGKHDPAQHPLLAQGQGNVDHGFVKIAEQCRLAGQQVDLEGGQLAPAIGWGILGDCPHVQLAISMDLRHTLRGFGGGYAFGCASLDI